MLEAAKTAVSIQSNDDGGFTVRSPNGDFTVPGEAVNSLDREGRDHYFALMFGLPAEHEKACQYFWQLTQNEE